MAAPINTANDYLLIEGLELVNYQQRTAPNMWTTVVTGMQAKRMPLSKMMMADAANLQAYDLVWHVWKTLMPGVIPKYDDRILDGLGFLSIVRKIDLVSLGNRFRLTCKMLPPSATTV